MRKLTALVLGLVLSASVGVGAVQKVPTSGLDVSAPVKTMLDSSSNDAVRTNIAVNPLASIAALKAYSTAGLVDGQVIDVTSYYASAIPDGGGGRFKWDSTSSATANDGTIIAPDAGGVGRWLAIGWREYFSGDAYSHAAMYQKSNFLAQESIEVHAHYGFLDESLITYPVGLGGTIGHASFNSNVIIQGTKSSDHHYSFQSYPHYTNSATLAKMIGHYSIVDHTGAGTITEVAHFKADDATGAGPITNNYGLYVASLARGSTNYAIYTAGITASLFGGQIQLGVGNQAQIEYDPNTGDLWLTPRSTYDAWIKSAKTYFGNGTKANAAYIDNNSDGNLYIKARATYETRIKSNVLALGSGSDAFNASLDNNADGNLYITPRSTYETRIGAGHLKMMTGKIYPATDAAASQTAAGIYAGSGVPNNANGANGDFYFRGDGTVAGGTTRYHKEAGAWVPESLTGSATYDPASLADGVGATTTVTVTGAALGDFAEASFSLNLQGITVTAWVSAADTVSVRFQNETAGTIDLASGTLRARVRKA